jgi:MFS family permease
LAAIAAVLATLGYATLAGVWPLLVARLIWGLAFAAMNIANQALPTAHVHTAPRRMGRARAIVAIGPMLGLLVGGILADLFGPRLVFALLAAVALIAPFFAAQLPSTPEPIVQHRPRLAGPDAFSVWSFSMGFGLDGLFVFGLSLLAVAGLGRNGVIAASIAMALRYISEILLSPVGGTLAHRYGARRMLVGLSMAAAAALASLAVPEPVLWFAVLATVVLRALLQPLPAPVIAQDCPGAARVPALARQAVWRDIGAAAGPLAGGLLFPVLPAPIIYAGAALLFAAASLGLARPTTRPS